MAIRVSAFNQIFGFSSLFRHWFLEAQRSGVAVDLYAFNPMIAAASRVGNFAAAKKWFETAREAGEEITFGEFDCGSFFHSLQLASIWCQICQKSLLEGRDLNIIELKNLNVPACEGGSTERPTTGFNKYKNHSPY